MEFEGKLFLASIDQLSAVIFDQMTNLPGPCQAHLQQNPRFHRDTSFLSLCVGFTWTNTGQTPLTPYDPPALTDALVGMHPGELRRVVVPPELLGELRGRDALEPALGVKKSLL